MTCDNLNIFPYGKDSQLILNENWSCFDFWHEQLVFQSVSVWALGPFREENRPQLGEKITNLCVLAIIKALIYDFKVLFVLLMHCEPV